MNTNVATMAHEIRSPLGGIIGILDILKTTTPLTEQQLMFIDEAAKAGRYLLDLADNILYADRLDADEKLAYETVEFDLADLLDFAIMNNLKDGVDITWVKGYNTPERVRGDLTKLRRVLINLLRNATKFTPVGQCIAVTVSALPEAPEGKIRLLFVVADTGKGIADDAVDRIWEKGFTTGGAGLGLPITKGLVNAIGGGLAVDSCLSVGTAVYFTALVEAV